MKTHSFKPNHGDFLKTLVSNLLTGVALILMSSEHAFSQQAKIDQSNIKELIKQTISDTATTQQVLSSSDLLIKVDGETKRYRYIPGGKGIPASLLKNKKEEFRILEDHKATSMGPGSTGGGFLHYRGAMPATVRALNFLIYQFENMNQDYLNFFLPDHLQNKIDPKKMASILSRTRYSYFQEGISVAPDNTVDFLEADWVNDKIDPHIILLKSYFQRYIDVSPTNEKLPFIMRTIVHEALHLFGVGVKKDSEAYDLSFNLIAAVVGKFNGCAVEEKCKALQTEDTHHIYNDLRMAYNKDITAVHNKVIQLASQANALGSDPSRYALKNSIFFHGSFLQVLSGGYCKTNPGYLVCLQAPLLLHGSYSDYFSPTLYQFLQKENEPENKLVLGSYFEFKGPEKNILFVLRPPDADHETNSAAMKKWIQDQNTNLCTSQSVKFVSDKKWKYVNSTLQYVICESQ